MSESAKSEPLTLVFYWQENPTRPGQTQLAARQDGSLYLVDHDCRNQPEEGEWWECAPVRRLGALSGGEILTVFPIRPVPLKLELKPGINLRTHQPNFQALELDPVTGKQTLFVVNGEAASRCRRGVWECKRVVHATDLEDGTPVVAVLPLKFLVKKSADLLRSTNGSFVVERRTNEEETRGEEKAVPVTVG